MLRQQHRDEGRAVSWDVGHRTRQDRQGGAVSSGAQAWVCGGGGQQQRLGGFFRTGDPVRVHSSRFLMTTTGPATGRGLLSRFPVRQKLGFFNSGLTELDSRPLLVQFNLTDSSKLGHFVWKVGP